MNITTYQICEGFDFGSYTRGKAYFLEGRVKSYKVISETNRLVKIESMVKGSKDNTYF